MGASEYKRKHNRLAFLGTLAGGLAHEIKNPLSAMSVNLQMLREDLEGTDQPRDQRLLKRVGVLEREVHRLEEILQRFLGYARGFSLQPVRLAVPQLLRETVEFWAAKARTSGIGVELVLDAELPEIAVDPTYFKQALLNLLNNAQEAIGDGDRPAESPAQIVISARPAAQAVDVAIIDTGPGIPPDVLGRIFDPYFSTKAGGSGLGLAISRRIIEEHGGTLTAQSEVGRGTSFRIRLPLAGEDDQEPGSEDEAGPES